MKTDFVAEFVAVAGEVAKLDSSAAEKLDQEIRARFGGQRVKVRFDPVVTPERIVSEMVKGRDVAEVSENLGVSRSTVYRRLADYKRKPKTGLG